MKHFLGTAAAIFAIFASAVLGWNFVFPPREIAVSLEGLKNDFFPVRQKSKEELAAEALEKSKKIKALYMTADVANDQGEAGKRLRRNIIRLAEETEINGVVIDVKEVCGPDYGENNLKNLLAELKEKNIWPIARIVVFKDASRIYSNPEWYLARKSAKAAGDECFHKRNLRLQNPGGGKPEIIFWRDRRGGYWLDPSHPEAREYIAEFSKKMIDLGFSELQFDYIRFPSDGDVENAVYPAWDGKKPKYEIMKSFFEFLRKSLKEYKPDIILSADLFGYAALNAGDVGIGQRLEDVESNFDYLSFMVYPSHYYHGLYFKDDAAKQLPAVNFSAEETRKNPGTTVYRSLLAARDFLDGAARTGTTSVSNSAIAAKNIADGEKNGSKARLRPWLEDFFHEEDKTAGRPYGKEKMRLQIEAAEKAENHGWMLWNASNVYTENALKKE